MALCQVGSGRVTRTGQHAVRPLYMPIWLRRFGHYSDLPCCVERVGILAGLCFLTVHACRLARFACPYRFFQLCGPVRVKTFPSCGPQFSKAVSVDRKGHGYGIAVESCSSSEAHRQQLLVNNSLQGPRWAWRTSCTWLPLLTRLAQ